MNRNNNKKCIFMLMFGVFIFVAVYTIKYPNTYILGYKIVPEISLFGFNSVPSLKIYGRTSSNDWIFDPALCPKISNITKASLRTPAGNTSIYIHNDDPVSKLIRTTGAFQPEIASLMCNLLKKEQTAQFLDLGGNIGSITLAVAKCGGRVFVVEPLNLNLLRLCNSVKEGNFTDRVTILNAAISNERKYVNLGIYGTNKGATYLVENAKQKVPIFNGTIMTATMDDILTVPGFQRRKTFIKMDIQGYEHKALEKGRKFFDQVDVRAVLVEWVLFRGTEAGKQIIKFFKERNFTPYNYETSQILSDNVSHVWPYDVLWKPNTN